MSNFHCPKKYHFLGIAGTAMTGVALMLKSRGDVVSGSDEAIYPPMSTVLASNGIDVRTPYRAENIPIDNETIVVVGNAISRGNPELEAVLERRLRYCSVPELLRWEILLPRKPIVVAGTHGKTTTTSLLAHLFEAVGENPGFLIGGVPKNFASGARLTDSKWFIIEGDEYDTAYFDKRSKFLHYVPHAVAMLNLEFDHADIFSSIEEIEIAFQRLALTIPANGLLVYNSDDKRLVKIAESALCKTISFGFQSGDVKTLRAEENETGWQLQVSVPEGNSVEFALSQPGKHAVMNALAAVAIGCGLGFDAKKCCAGFVSFAGVARRVDVLFDGEVTVIDDFGHHPTAVKTTLLGLRKKYPGRRILCAFDPRSNTSVRKFFQTEWVAALQPADRVWINQLHRLEKIPESDRLDRNRLVRELSEQGYPAIAADNVEQIERELFLELQSRDVVVFFSNGAFGGLKERVVERLKNRN